jgi:hypothetical protein
VEKRNLHTLLGGMEASATTLENNMVIAVLFTIAKLWKQPNASLLKNNKLRKCGFYIQWHFNQP